MLTLVCVANHTLASAAAALKAAGAPDCTLLPSLDHTRERGQEAGVVAVLAQDDEDPPAAYQIAVALMVSSSQEGGESAAYVIPAQGGGRLIENPHKR